MSVVEIHPWHLLLKGGPMVWPILACWLLSLTIVIERFNVFQSWERRFLALGKKVFDAVKKNDLKHAVELCDEQQDLPLAEVLKTGLLMSPCGKEEISCAMEEAARDGIASMEKGLTTLGMMATIAPLLGVLGTIMGMAEVLRTFQVRALALNALTPTDMAAGIWAALITTAAGVLVAIFVFLTHHYLSGRVQGLVAGLEHDATELADLLTGGSRTVDQGDGA